MVCFILQFAILSSPLSLFRVRFIISVSAAHNHLLSLAFCHALLQGIPGPPGDTGAAGYPGRQVQ